MVDIENEVFTEIANSLRKNPTEIFVTGEYLQIQSKFPCVSVIQMDSTTYEKTLDSSGEEKFTEIMYEVNIYSNKTVGKKSQAKEIASIVDDEFRKLGFSRIMLNPVPNLADNTIYRLVARYRAIVSDRKDIYLR